MTARGIGYLGLACCLALPGAEAPEQLRVTTHYVELGVIAHTKQGELIRDLAKEDFTLFDQGRPVRIAVFRTEATASVAQAPIRLPAGVFTNRVQSGAAGATVILFDGLNTQFVDQAYARQQIIDFLHRLPAGERVALYVLGRGPRVLQDFTDDPGTLVKALEGYQPAVSPSLEAPLYNPSLTRPAQFDAWLGELTFDLHDYFAPERGFRTVRTLVAIANHLERLPGRKNLVWVSGSFPVSLDLNSAPSPRRNSSGRQVTPDEMDRAIRALSRANVAVYPVDARGLIARQEYAGPSVKPELRNPDTSMFPTMNVLADRTGGRAFYNNNDLSGALRRAVEDAHASYSIGYYPSHDSWNGRFRKLELRVSRPGVELQYRRGYFAQRDEPTEPWYRERVLDAALWSPIDAAGLGLTVYTGRSKAGELMLDLQVDPRDIAFRQEDGKWQCGLDIWLVQLDRKEKRLKTDAKSNNLRLEPEMYHRSLEAGGLLLKETLKPAPDAVLLRVLVRDVASGALGSLTVPIAPR